MTSNWLSWFTSSPQEVERAETLALLQGVRRSQSASPFHTDEDISKFRIDIISKACERWCYLPGVPLGGALFNTIDLLMKLDELIGDLPADELISSLSMEEGVRFRAELKRRERFFNAHQHLLPIWRDKLVWLFSGMLDYFPESAFIDVDEDGTVSDNSVVFPRAPIFDLCDNLPEVIERAMATFYDRDITEAQLFEPLRTVFDENLYTASGIPRERRYDSNIKVISPTQSKIREPAALVDTYLQGTPLQYFFYQSLPFAIPFPARFEHTHIVGGTGHGKTQLMQFLIYHDLIQGKDDKRSVVVIDSQGDLIRTVSRLGLFAEPEYADRFVLVDPNDVEYPVCLNMFDFKRDRLSGYAPVDREKILNATIELYEYFFGALLGAELTQRQGLIFKYLARLLIEIPDATIHTLVDLMEHSERYRPYMEKLTGTARAFFATQFFERKFSETKKQILTRLWGVLSNSSLERMFSHTRNKVDLFELMNQGKIVFINTAKDLLGQDGAAIFGRFFIALISQASIQRAAMPPHERRPAFVYIDEAQDYFDDSISHLLNQARKYRVGLVFAHQNLDQLSAGLRSSVLASTTIKFAGGVSAKDANVLDSEFRCTSDFLLQQKKRKHQTEFACYVKNFTNKAVTTSVPFGSVEEKLQLSAQDHNALLERNRDMYSEPYQPVDWTKPVEAEYTTRNQDEADWAYNRQSERSEDQASNLKRKESSDSPSPPRQQPISPKVKLPPEAGTPGRGGRQHKYLQQLVKQLAEERGFRATIEETILDGSGRVDVSLQREKLRIACQVTVTTTKDWELNGVEKCLAAGYTEVVLIGSNERHINKIGKFIVGNLEPQDQERVRCMTADSLVEYLDDLGTPIREEQVVRGYKVTTVRQTTGVDEGTVRRKAISEVIAKSIQKSGRGGSGEA